MKPNKIIYLLLLAMTFAGSPRLFAQKDLHISQVFEQYGKRKGTVMVELTNEALGSYNFSLFKSIIIRNDPAAAKFTRNCISRDEQGAKKIKQVVANGVPTSIYLQLPRKGKDNRLILYNESAGNETRMTLIYIETESDSEDVLKVLLKKK
jgi:hypothetical protein